MAFRNGAHRFQPQKTERGLGLQARPAGGHRGRCSVLPGNRLCPSPRCALPLVFPSRLSTRTGNSVSRRPFRALLLTLALAACAPVPTRGPATLAPTAFDSALGVATFDSAWARVRAFHYDTTFGGLDWNAVRDELRPQALAARSDAELRRLIMGMVARLGVSHYALIPRDAGAALAPERAAAARRAADGGTSPDSIDVPGHAGLEVRLAEGQLVTWRVDPAGTAAAAGIAPGLRVTHVQDGDMSAAVARIAALDDARERQLAETRFLHGVNGMLRGERGDTITLGILRAGDSVALAVPLGTSSARLIRFGNLPPMFAELHTERRTVGEHCVGVIALSVWMTPLAAELDRAIDGMRDCRGIVLDLRGNPGGVAGMVMGIGGHFVDSVQALGTMRTRSNELRFVLNPRRVNPRGQAVPVYDGALAVLVDGMSASTSEIFAAGMQAIGRARVFGEVSAGQALPAMAGSLPNGDILMHAIADYLVIDGTRVEGVGVVPDEVVPLRLEEVRAGRDAALEAALRWVAARPAT